MADHELGHSALCRLVRPIFEGVSGERGPRIGIPRKQMERREKTVGTAGNRGNEPKAQMRTVRQVRFPPGIQPLQGLINFCWLSPPRVALRATLGRVIAS